MSFLPFFPLRFLLQREKLFKLQIVFISCRNISHGHRQPKSIEEKLITIAWETISWASISSEMKNKLISQFVVFRICNKFFVFIGNCAFKCFRCKHLRRGRKKKKSHLKYNNSLKSIITRRPSSSFLSNPWQQNTISQF